MTIEQSYLIAELESQVARLWQFARSHSGYPDEMIETATRVRCPFDKEEQTCASR